MDYDALLTEVLAPLPQKTGEQCCGRYRIRTGRRYSLKIRLQCRMHVSKPLRGKSFHGVPTGNAREYSLKPRIGKVRQIQLLPYFRGE
jgi:hypothetical protein